MLAATLLLLVCAGAGCAVHYTDKRGNRHIVGLANVTLPPSDSMNESYGYSVKSLGVMLHLSEELRGFTVGYSDSGFIVLQDGDGEILTINPDNPTDIEYLKLLITDLTQPLNDPKNL